MSGRRKQATSDTKTEILDAAALIMEEEGYAAVSSRRIAERAGMKSMPIHYHFGSMDELFLALYRRFEKIYFDRLVKAMGSDSPLRGLWALNRDPRDTGLIGEFLALANHRPAIRDEVARSGERVRAIETAIIAAALRNGDLEPGKLEPDVLAFVLAATCRTLLTERALGIDAAHDKVEACVERLLDQLDPARGTAAARQG
ncbi:hypothetical protein B2G71_05035 [Novosphingobium sp. PC22D]|uniref:TetR/AcrR family transcriptional regulator n=1 Tax=Novosphingobium sp. PC22D TaxID=1962403 RepID=UPI000BF07105|nr:TetR/AcrR family transcriptional regulator [Novosphingobium sp. PC22D]PEQ13689.1 hypothetical protein B2G71_05035 [Novosphingobium sp. PC22D]